MKYRLDCGHIIADRTPDNGELYCGKCFSLRKAVEEMIEYRAKCQKCAFSRVHFIERDALHDQMRHALRSGHRVNLTSTAQLQLW